MERIKKFEKIIKENSMDMTAINILYSMSCHDNYSKLTDMQKNKILNFIDNVYMDDETNTSIGTLSDLVMDDYKKVLNGTLEPYDIYMSL